MSYAAASIYSAPCPCIRRLLTTGVTVAGAGILAVSLVVVPSDSSGAKFEVRATQLASLAFPSSMPSPADLERFVENFVGAQSRLHTRAFTGDVSDITSAITRIRTFDLTINPSTGNGQVAAGEAIGNQQVNSALSSTPGDAFNTITTLVAAVFLAPAVVGFVGLALAISLVQNFFYNLQNNATAAPALMSESLSSNPESAVTTRIKPKTAVLKDWKKDFFPTVTKTSKQPPTDQINPPGTDLGNEQIFTGTKTLTKSPADEPSDLSNNAVRSMLHKPLARALTGVGERVRDLLHRGKGGDETDRTGDGAPTNVRPSVDGKSPGGNTTDGDADGS
jgi:hypothetical protein